MTQLFLLMFALFVAMMIALSFYWNNKTTKFVAIALLAFLANAVYFSLDGVKGWPAEESQEIKGRLASVVIINPSSESDGAIYISLFVTTPHKWYEYVYPRYAPKTFYVEYTNNRAAEFEKAKQAISEGKEVRINGIPPKESSGGQNSDGEMDDSIGGVIGQFLEKILPKQGDTYNPKVPDVEIIAPEIPQKGTNQ